MDVYCDQCGKDCTKKYLTEVNPEGGFDRPHYLMCDDCLRDRVVSNLLHGSLIRDANKQNEGEVKPDLVRLLQDKDAEIKRLEAINAELMNAAETMVAYEDHGGDGWWSGWDMLKAALAKAKGEE